jgi:hypothetical protein
MNLKLVGMVLGNIILYIAFIAFCWLASSGALLLGLRVWGASI